MTFVLDRAEMAKQGGLGLELTDVEFRTNRRVFVKSVRPGSVAAQAGIPKGFVVVSVNGISAERTNARGAAQLILGDKNNIDITQTKSENTNKVTLLLRDPAAFSEGLQNLANVDQGTVSTQVAPAGGQS
jgi:S1-C subfamily serine protease